MWYLFQTAIIGSVAYAYLTKISDQKDILHAIALGTIVALYATVIVSGILNALGKLIRAIRSMLLSRDLPTLRRHKKADKLIHVNASGSTRTPRLITKQGLDRPARDRS